MGRVVGHTSVRAGLYIDPTAQLSTQAAQIGALQTALTDTARNPFPVVSTFVTSLSDPPSAAQRAGKNPV